ncbi:MAG: hypothetical protein HYY67_01785 [Thaumarchaeota archaeon]|nr:hypothetical protein [Nitrososphaerota archaeon]
MSEDFVKVDEGNQKAVRAILESISGQNRYTPVVKIAKGSASSLLDLLEKADFDAKFDIAHSALRDAILGTPAKTLADLWNKLESGLATETTLGLIKAKTDNLDAALSTRATEITLAAIKAQTDKLAFDASNNLKTVSAGGSTELATYVVMNTAAQASAANKHFISLFNATGSGKIMKIHEIWARYTQAAAVTGVGFNMNVKRTTAQGSGGTTLTPRLYDENDPAIPAQVTALQVPTTAPTEQDIIRDFFTATEGLMETTGHAGAFTTMFPIFQKRDGLRPLVCREGKGITVKQITSSTVGTWSIEILFTLE